MAAVVNDKNRFISSITDTITLYCRLALKYNSKIKLDGCLAVTVDDDKTIVVNVSQAVEGQNTNAIYPSLRVNGRDGQTYVLLKDRAFDKTNTSATNKTPPNTRSLSQLATPVIAGRTPTVGSGPRCHIVRNTGAAHLLVSPQSPVKQRTPIIIVTPQKSQLQRTVTPMQMQQSLLTGRRFVTKTTSASTSTSEDFPQTSGAEQSTMSNRNSKVLQSRTVPDSQQVELVEVKSEPEDDPAYEHSQNLSTHITQFFRGELEGTESQDKENSSVGGGSISRRSSTHAEVNAPKRRRTSTTGSVTQSTVETRNARQNEAQTRTEKSNLAESPRRKSSRLQGGNIKTIAAAENTSTKETLPEPTVTVNNTSEEPNSPTRASVTAPPVEDFQQETTDEEFDSEDDALSTATSEEETEELYRCSDKFTADCTKSIKNLNSILGSLKKDMEQVGKKEGAKEVRSKFTRTVNIYSRAVQDFEVAKSQGSSDIKATENKIEKDLDAVLDNFEKITTMLPKVLKQAKTRVRA